MPRDDATPPAHHPQDSAARRAGDPSPEISRAADLEIPDPAAAQDSATRNSAPQAASRVVSRAAIAVAARNPPIASPSRTVFGSPILGMLNLPNALTLAGLALGLFSAWFAVLGQFHAAILCLIWAGVADLFDGMVARKRSRTELEASVGRHLDSLCDVCSFGLSPGVFAFSLGLREPWYVILLLFYVWAAAMRLAYFDAVGLDTEGDRQFFTGMPVTYAALFIPAGFSLVFWLGRGAELEAILGALYFCLGSAMVSGQRVPKPRGTWYVVFSVLAIGLTAVHAWAIASGRGF